MRTTPTCLPCLLKRVGFEADLTTDADTPSHERQRRRDAAQTAAEAILAERHDPTAPRVNTDLATELHRAVYAALDHADPYVDLKAHANRVALQVRPSLWRWASDAPDEIERLTRLLQLSVAGNVVDFGIAGSADPADLEAVVRTAARVSLDAGIASALIEHLDRLTAADEVLLLTDNCGEVALDVPLTAWLAARGHRVTVLAKPAPILTDATVDDVLAVGLGEVATDVGTIGGNSVGLIAAEQPEALQQRLRQAGLIIAKGMGYWESLSDHPWWGPRLHLLKTKCGPVAASVGVPEGTHVARLMLPGDPAWPTGSGQRLPMSTA